MVDYESISAKLRAENNEFYLSKLKNVLQRTYPDAYFSIGEYRDFACCIEEKESKWIIYTGERGQKNGLIEKDNVIDACLCLLDIMADTAEMRRQTWKQFSLLVHVGRATPATLIVENREGAKQTKFNFFASGQVRRKGYFGKKEMDEDENNPNFSFYDHINNYMNSDTYSVKTMSDIPETILGRSRGNALQTIAAQKAQHEVIEEIEEK